MLMIWCCGTCVRYVKQIDSVFFCPCLLRSVPLLCFGRYGLFEKQLALLEEAEGGFDQFTSSYSSYGVQRMPDNSLFFKEWAPAAEALFLTGDFSTSFLILKSHVYDSAHQY